MDLSNVNDIVTNKKGDRINLVPPYTFPQGTPVIIEVDGKYSIAGFMSGDKFSYISGDKTGFYADTIKSYGFTTTNKDLLVTFIKPGVKFYKIIGVTYGGKRRKTRKNRKSRKSRKSRRNRKH